MARSSGLPFTEDLPHIKCAVCELAINSLYNQTEELRLQKYNKQVGSVGGRHNQVSGGLTICLLLLPVCTAVSDAQISELEIAPLVEQVRPCS